ncbi:MAG: hypothetical protein AMDU5_GPLC00004G0293 [Thermoplasmatales archaeon Gpl]|jgi:adenosine deaminase|nr:MAG: hypothetical protein AMDU5_GPLC00004G0293 [Thermoplasmatales archaeon Gpl]
MKLSPYKKEKRKREEWNKFYDYCINNNIEESSFYLNIIFESGDFNAKKAIEILNMAKSIENTVSAVTPNEKGIRKNKPTFNVEIVNIHSHDEGGENNEPH